MTGTWHEGLVDYTGGTEDGALRAEHGLSQLGNAADIKFRFDQHTNWQPVDSQRLLLWAGESTFACLLVTCVCVCVCVVCVVCVCGRVKTAQP